MLKNHARYLLSDPNNRNELLKQYEYWRPAGQSTTKLEDMDYDHLLNLRDWFGTNCVRMYREFYQYDANTPITYTKAKAWIQSMPLYISLEHEIKERKKRPARSREPQHDLKIFDAQRGSYRYYVEIGRDIIYKIEPQLGDYA